MEGLTSDLAIVISMCSLRFSISIKFVVCFVHGSPPSDSLDPSVEIRRGPLNSHIAATDEYRKRDRGLKFMIELRLQSNFGAQEPMGFQVKTKSGRFPEIVVGARE